MAYSHRDNRLRQELIDNHTSELRHYFAQAREQGAPQDSVIFAFDLRDAVSRSVLQGISGKSLDGAGLSQPADLGSGITATSIAYVAIPRSRLTNVFQSHIPRTYVSEELYLDTPGPDEFSVVLLAEGGITTAVVSLY